jgi:hypothetical protein
MAARNIETGGVPDQRLDGGNRLTLGGTSGDQDGPLAKGGGTSASSMCCNGAMKAVAWLIMFSSGILAFGFLLAFVDLVATGVTTGDPYRYEAMMAAFVLFAGAAYVGWRAFRYIRRRADPAMTTSIT